MNMLENDMDTLLNSDEIEQSSAIDGQKSAERSPSKWHLLWSEDNKYYDVRSVLAMLNRQYHKAWSKDRLTKVMISCKQSETCPEYQRIHSDQLKSCNQFIGHGHYIAFLFDIVTRDEHKNTVISTEKDFFIGQVIKMVNAKTATRTRTPLHEISDNCKIFCRWLKRVEDSSSITTAHTYEWGPAEDNTLFVLGRFAISQVRLTKVDPDNISLSAKYILNSSDYDTCKQYVLKAEELQLEIDKGLDEKDDSAKRIKEVTQVHKQSKKNTISEDTSEAKKAKNSKK